MTNITTTEKELSNYEKYIKEMQERIDATSKERDLKGKDLFKKENE